LSGSVRGRVRLSVCSTVDLSYRRRRRYIRCKACSVASQVAYRLITVITFAEDGGYVIGSVRLSVFNFSARFLNKLLTNLDDILYERSVARETSHWILMAILLSIHERVNTYISLQQLGVMSVVFVRWRHYLWPRFDLSECFLISAIMTVKPHSVRTGRTVFSAAVVRHRSKRRCIVYAIRAWFKYDTA